MSTQTILKGAEYEWTCDRCGAVKRFLEGHAPKDWRSVECHPRFHAMLCADCLSEFPKWFRDA
jgi:hypothetical protein